MEINNGSLATVDGGVLVRSAEGIEAPAGHTGILNDRYRIVRELGRGGMAVVYLAEQVDSGRQVALKTMSTRLTGTAKQRFTREFSTIASLKHPHLIEVYEYGETRSGPFFAMELFSGQPATAMIGAPLPKLLEAIFNLCEAVDFVHSKRIIHRDIKPANILVDLEKYPKRFDIRLADFGLAKFANTSSTLSGDVNFLGTIAYCSPEQIMREELDHRADLYSLGMVVYEILAGRHPFHEQRRNAQAMIAKQLNGIPKRLREYNPELSVELEAAVMRLMEKDAADRPESTSEIKQVIAWELGWSEDFPLADSLLALNLVPPFVAREADVVVLQSIIGAALSPSTRGGPTRERHITSLVFVEGQAGIGKTTLIRRAAKSALAEGTRIYDGRCFDGNLSPFQPFTEIVRQILSEHEKCRQRASQHQMTDALASTTFLQPNDATTQVESVIEEYASELSRCGSDLRKLLANRVPSLDLEEPRDPEFVFRTVAKFFVDISRIQPVMLLIEDVHWADQSSKALLRHIASEMSRARQNESDLNSPRLVVVATCRNTSEYSAIQAFIVELTDAELAARHTLEALNREGCLKLIASQLRARTDEVDSALLQKVSHECMGNPFYICQTIQDWLLTQVIHRVDSVWSMKAGATYEGLPQSVQQAMLTRLARLPERVQKCLGIAAAIGSSVNVELLQRVYPGHDDFEFLDVVDDLLARDILRESNQPRELLFAHDIFREASLAGLSATRRQGIHRAIGEELEARSREASKSVKSAVLAEHFSQSGESAKAFKYLIQAAREASIAFAYEDALHLLDRVDSFVNEDRAQPDLRAMKQLRGETHLAMNDIDSAISSFKDTLALSDLPIEKAAAYRGLANCAMRRGRLEIAGEYYESALRQFGEKQPQNILGVLLSTSRSFAVANFVPNWALGKVDEATLKPMAEIYFLYCLARVHGDVTRYLDVAAKNMVLARKSADPDLTALSYSKTSFNLALSGTLTGAFAVIYRKKILKALGNCSSDFSIATATYQLGAMDYMAGRYEAAEPRLIESWKLLEKSRDWHMVMNAHFLRHLNSSRGDVAEIERWALEELEFGKATQDPNTQSWGELGLADAWSRQGRFQDAVDIARHAIAITENTEFQAVRCVDYQELGRALLQASQYSEAEKALRTGIFILKKHLYYFDFATQNFSLLPEAIVGPEWSRGPEAINRQTRRRAASAIKTAKFFAISFPNMRAHTHRVAGRVAAACGHQRKALKHFDHAITFAAKIGNKYEHARALIDKSMVCAASDTMNYREDGLRRLAALDSVLPQVESQLLAVI